MCNGACMLFIRENLSRRETEGRRVLEIGALNVNGSPREIVLPLSPRSYTGVDLTEGAGVDEVCDVTELSARFGTGSFDVVLSTEMLEHVRDWRGAISNIKDVLKPGGLLLLTTRSRGYPYHGYPYDFWRYEEDDIRAIFSDMTVLSVARDPLVPGIFLKARKPDNYSPGDLSGLELYSVIAGERRTEIGWMEIAFFRIKRIARETLSAILPGPLKRFLKGLAGRQEHNGKRQ